jgi:hypothetical protein
MYPVQNVDSPEAGSGQRPHRGSGADRYGDDPDHAGPRSRVVRSWPLILVAAPASVAVWSGWVGIGQMTGFGMVRPLPGIADSVRIDTAITLPLGVEAYAAYALSAWLAGSTTITARTRRFAFWSAIGSFLLGMTGQVAYHLLAQSGAVRAPWEVTMLVSCLPVLVLGMGAALAHMIHADAALATCGTVDQHQARPEPDGPDLDVSADQDQAVADRPATADQEGDLAADRGDVAPAEADQTRLDEVRSIASSLAASGQRVSRRALRAAGVRGSNAELGNVARLLDPAATSSGSRHRPGKQTA